ncbi:MAG: hypothetical protein FWF29_00400 [Treponema sp.]|nr:hypothetical protein [Treponema sp.]
MKRIILVLTVFTLASVFVFAEDGFSWEGNAEIGTVIRGLNDFPDNPEQAAVKESTKVATIEPYGKMQGELDLYYTKGGLQLETVIIGRYLAQGYNEGNADVSFGASYIHPKDLFGFYLSTYIIQAAGTANAVWFSTGPDRLWMYYNMMKGDLRLYLAYKGRAEWDFNVKYVEDWRISDLFMDRGFVYYPLDTALNLGGPDPKDNLYGSGMQIKYLGVPGLDAGITFGAKGAIAGYSLDASVSGVTNKTIYDVVKSFFIGHSIFGAKYAFDTMGASGLTGAFMFGLETLYDSAYVDPTTFMTGKYLDTTMHVYMGADYRLKDTVDLYGEVRVDDLLARYNKGPVGYIGAGGSYNPDPLYAGLQLMMVDPGAANASEFIVQPRLHYNIVADTLQARFPVEIGANLTENYQTLTLSPTLIWNIAHNGLNNDLGQDGVGDYRTGIIARYNVGFRFADANKVNMNNLELTFRVSF